MPLRRLHRLIASALALFLVLHLAHHATLAGGTDTHLAVQARVSPLYRWFPIEVLLMTLLAVQIGIGLLLSHRNWPRARGWRRVQIWSGVVLGGFMVMHVGAAWMYRLQGLETTVHFAASGMFHPAMKWFFYFYYPAALIALASHVAALLALRRIGPAWLPKALPALAAAYGVFILLGLSGTFGGPPPPAEYLYSGSELP